MNVVLAGGGTAGHVEPALALADVLRDRGHTVTALGTARGLETTLVPARGYELDLIPPVPLPRRLTGDLLKVPFRVRRSVRETREALRRRRCDVVVGFGGYVALPAYLAARRRVPIVVHEANASAGLANKVGARFAARVAVTYPDSGLPKAELVGLPLRAAISSLGQRAARRAEARAEFGLDPDRPALLVTGGSQGARRINQAVTAAAPTLAASGVQVLHATGAKNAEDVRRALAEGGLSGEAPPYVAVPYVDRMELAYAACDLALCRSGAMTVAELTAVGLPAVFVPLPIGNGEQRLNAVGVVAAGGGLMVDDHDLTDYWVNANVLPLLRDPDRLAGMSAAAASCGRPDAAGTLADMVEAVAR
ncbi:MAG TPA: undecaprenyldiphospho-muramoylpentapeptide beta-N-acetylglucosaminyltransferase [Mycobacteriales bacterium]|jgi:UDP-N-acetylglucosamine--N-acetylmuramyl-(pentapeptide) pyrophosphoryl-undecaprenol N-acetylglucosamine transferase|nr:undecaprenyldiphospho-muramoylpentapeptide beta-N-acetylglucosaminyltransferase [Mycobacteriales bacterium]